MTESSTDAIDMKDTESANLLAKKNLCHKLKISLQQNLILSLKQKLMKFGKFYISNTNSRVLIVL